MPIFIFIFIFFFFGVCFCSCFCDCRVKRLLASYSVQRERQIGAGAKCCGGEEGVCEECVWRRVPTRCQRGGILKQQSLSSSSVILSLHSPNVWVLSSFVLPPPPAVTFSFMWQAAQQKHQSPFVNVNCRWPNNLGVSESVDCFELNFNV